MKKLMDISEIRFLSEMRNSGSCAKLSLIPRKKTNKKSLSVILNTVRR